VPKLPLTENGKLDLKTLRAFTILSKTKLPFQRKSMTELEVEITKVWGELFNKTEIQEDSDFFALGGHSLLAIQLLSVIEKRYHLTLSIQDLYTASSLRSFCRCLENKLLNKVLPNYKIEQSTCMRNQSLIALNSRGKKSPLFLIHPLGGTVFVYLDLVRYLTIDRPIYGIPDPGITKPEMKYDSLRELASQYLEWIQVVQPEGPYYLAGSSLGGTLAYEIAYQLEQKGFSKNIIIMFDSWALYTEDFSDQKRLKEGLMRQYYFIKEKLGFFNLPQTEQLIQLNFQRLQLVLHYHPPTLNQPLWLFKSKILRPEFVPIESSDNHWKKYCRGTVHTFFAPGDHESMLVGENAKYLSIHLKEVLDDK